MSEQPLKSEAELVEFVRAIDVRAPDELHAKVAALVAERSSPSAPRATRRPFPLLAGTLGAVAVAALLAVLLIGSSGGSSTPSVSATQAATLTLAPATKPAPVENPHADAQLAANVDGVAFPYWEDRFGWRSTGARIDTVAGRTVMTVFYANAAHQRIGYAIVSGTPAPRLSGRGVVAWRGSTAYHVVRDGDTRMVVWLRDGRMCVVAGHNVSSATLLRLASWDDRAQTT